jgi:transglutaminase-like putative cysteine protease
LWNVPLKSNAARTGMSDFMRPGDVANLSLSDEVAFRAEFQGLVPPRRELYWRGLVLSKLDDGAWRSLLWRDIPGTQRRVQQPVLRGDFADYSVIMEPTQQNWLYSIAYATTRDRGIIGLNDFRLISPVEVQDQKRYQVRSWFDVALEPELGEWRRRVETALPREGNPRTRELAERMFDEAAGDPARYAQSVLEMFRQQAYFYTLRPPLLGENRIDQFLFETRRGFCEHYAAAFTWMMRAVDVPARVVAGYQGGEINPLNGTVIVHQFDAHAWNEIWIEGRGWVRMDPTAAIAPDRIEYGLEEALAEEGSFLSETPLSPLRYRDIDWLNAIRLQLDAINYSWQVFVLGFNREEQYDLLNRMLGDIDRKQLVIGVVLLWVLLLLPVGLYMLWQSRGPRLDPPTRLYMQFCERMRRAGLARHAHESPSQYARRIATDRPALTADVEAITAGYQSLAYAGNSDAATMAELRRRVKRFRG